MLAIQRRVVTVLRGENVLVFVKARFIFRMQLLLLGEDRRLPCIRIHRVQIRIRCAGRDHKRSMP